MYCTPGALEPMLYRILFPGSQDPEQSLVTYRMAEYTAAAAVMMNDVCKPMNWKPMCSQHPTLFTPPRQKKQAGFVISCVGSVRDVVLRLAGAERPSTASPSAPAPSQANTEPGSSSSCFTAGDEERGVVCGQEEAFQGEQQQQQPMLCTCPGDRFEVLSLVGTVSPDGLHLHASLGDEEGAVSGGHLVRAIVHTTAEVVVGEASALAFSRVMDPDTGFKELVVAGRDFGERGVCGSGGGGGSGGGSDGGAGQR